MAIYHLCIKVISRGKGKSAVAAAAYRSGEVITNEYDGVRHDFTAKRGIVHDEILLPDHAPREYKDRAILWNAVEKCERYKTAQLARELEIALPKELTLRENKSLVRRYVAENFVSKGMCADIAIHDTDEGNPHAHIMLTIRPIEQDGTWGQKSRTVDGVKIPTVDWNEKERAEEWRAAWADTANLFLEKLNHEARIDHRSYERQGLDIIPTVHMGVAATQMERRGIRTERGNKNREINELNKQLRQIKARIRRLEDELKAIPDTPPTLFEIFSEMANRPENRTQKQKIADLRLIAQTLNFIQTHNIETLADLSAVVQNLHAEYNTMHNTVTEMSRRYQTLTEHIKHAETYTKHAAVFTHWSKLKGGKEDAYYKKHSEEINICATAHDYLKRHLNGRTNIPLGEWRREFSELSARRDTMLLDSDRLRDDVQSAEVIKRNAYKVMGVAEPKRNRTQGIEM